MGLVLTVKGFDEEIYDSGYMGFTQFRIAVLSAYDKDLGTIYQKWLKNYITDANALTSAENVKLRTLLKTPWKHLLLHSDCDGKLTPRQCKAIYNLTKDLRCDYQQANYLDTTGKNLLEVFNRALKFCYENKVSMNFE